MRTAITIVYATIPLAVLWSIGCASIGAFVALVTSALLRKRPKAETSNSADFIRSIRERREANEARMEALDSVVAELAAPCWRPVKTTEKGFVGMSPVGPSADCSGECLEERIEAIRKRVDEKLAAKRGEPVSVGPVPVDPGVAGPKVGPVPVDPGDPRKRTWADVRRDQLNIANYVAGLPRPAGWADMDERTRWMWILSEECPRLHEINAEWWKEENERREALAKGDNQETK